MSYVFVTTFSDAQRDLYAQDMLDSFIRHANGLPGVVLLPFGGQGLSGTGPKAGGPHYLQRFAAEKTRTDNVVAKGGNTQLFSLQEF